MSTNSPCDSCGGTGITGFNYDMSAVKCIVCKGTGVYSGVDDFGESGL